MNELIQHIEGINAKSKAEMEANPGTFIGILTTDVEHWAEMGVHTVEDFERYELQTFIYEGHKDAFGVKGRHYDFDSMTMEELKEEANYIAQAANEAFEAEQKAEEEAVRKFEGFVQEMLKWGTSDRKTAVRWLLEAEKFDAMDLMYGGEVACFKMNLPYRLYQKEFDAIMKEMKPYEEAA